MKAEELAMPESWKRVKVRAAPYKPADPPGWNLFGWKPLDSQTYVGGAGGVLGRQTVPVMSNQHPCSLMQT